MQIGCTQKLLTYLNKEPEAVEEGMDAFYSWSATLLTIRRRKTIVVVHDASRCGFVLYGVTAKQLKQMDQLLIEGIRRMLEAECIVPEVVQEYLQGCGLAIRYTKTQNRSAVARLNQLRQSLSDFHQTLQILFGWKDYHLHSFELEPDLPLDITMPEYASLASMDDWGMCDTEPMERWLLLSEVLERYPHFWYIYDMGDRWEHEITLVSQENMTAFSGPQCILALGDAPPEDVGGADGFAELLELLQHPEDPEYLAAKQWLEGTGWKPLDMEQLQNTLNWRSNLR